MAPITRPPRRNQSLRLEVRGEGEVESGLGELEERLRRAAWMPEEATTWASSSSPEPTTAWPFLRKRVLPEEGEGVSGEAVWGTVWIAPQEEQRQTPPAKASSTSRGVLQAEQETRIMLGHHRLGGVGCNRVGERAG